MSTLAEFAVKLAAMIAKREIKDKAKRRKRNKIAKASRKKNR